MYILRKGNFITILLLLVISLFITACGSSGNSNNNLTTNDSLNNDKGFKPQTIRVSAPRNEKTTTVQGANKFKEIVEEKTNNKVEVRVHPNGELGSLRETTELVELGELEIALTDMGTMTSFIEASKVFTLPYV